MNNNDLNLDTLGFSNCSKDDKKIFIGLTADYRNIGDIAITIAQRKLLSEVFPDRKIIEIPMTKAYEYEPYIKNILNNDDILTLIGGGNLGNIYITFEERRRFIINLFKNNKIISFPQSIDFTNNDNGINEFNKSIEIYSQNPNLVLLARETKSFNIMQNNFKNKVTLIPDTVFYLKDYLKDFSIPNRNRITICLRDDREKITNSNLTNDLTNILKEHEYETISIMDTIIEDIYINPDMRINRLIKFFNDYYYNSKLIITDRLHGMIFAVITNTPCIAFDNSNKKISSTYNTWLKNEPLIKFFDNYNEEDIINTIENFSKIENYNTSIEHISEKFDLLKEILQN